MPTPDRGPVGVALSGGADSVALLSVMHELGYDVRALHCNYRLRGDESERDERVAREVARRVGAEIYVIRPDVKGTMERYGESLEMACRRLRYEWFGKEMEEQGLAAIALGHHREDNVETMLLNVLRTTGLRGARGMEPWADGKMRPLLGMSRRDIEKYAELKRLAWITDSSNGVNDVKRNRLRNIVIPAMSEQFGPGTEERLAATTENLRDDYEFMQEQLSRIVEASMDEAGGLDLKKLRTLTGHGHHAVRHYGMKYGLTMEQAREIMASADSSGRRWRLSDGVTEAYNDHGTLRLMSAHQECGPLKFSDFHDLRLKDAGLIAEFLTREELEARGGVKALRGSIFLDAEAVMAEDAEFEWRSWRQGDRIRPFGMGGRSKLVSDVMNDARLGAGEKSAVRVLTRNGEVLWVAPLRASIHFAITPRTQKIIALRQEK